MSENHFCCCPRCRTVFRLSGENLSRQSTRFRCYSCREVFDSRVNTVSMTDSGFVIAETDSVNDDRTEVPVFDGASGIGVEDSGSSSEGGGSRFDQPESLVSEEAPSAWRRENTAYEYIKDRREPLIALAWCVASVALFILLSLQIKYFYVEKYAQDQSFRKYLVGFCKIASCELPPLKSPDLFTLADTKIDRHPRQPDALRVTVKLHNRAVYAQPYPDLRITLTDRDGRVVGRRSFPPQSWLAADSENMVGGDEQVSLLFDLARPHEKAVGFAVNIVTD